MSLEAEDDYHSQSGPSKEKYDAHVSITPQQFTQPREIDIKTSSDGIQEHFPFSNESILDQDSILVPEDSARTPTSTDYHGDAAQISSDRFGTVSFGAHASEVNKNSYFSTDSLWSSNLSSPIQSAHPSSSSLQNTAINTSLNSDDPATDLPCCVRDLATANSASAQISTASSNNDLPTFISKEARSLPRREGPRYPDQSFAALQPQYHSPPYLPYPLRTRSSHPSDSLGYSSDSSRRSRDRSSVNSGAKTVGNTPAQSPGLFSTTYPRIKLGGEESEESRYKVPLLHPTHLQAPKETHKLLKDIDPISGRKIINNYEFYAKLGSGTHGTVKLGRNLVTGELVAIKIVRRFSKKVRLGKQESPEDKVKKEVAVLKKARHPHVVSLIEVIDDPEFGKVYLVLEYVELGEIRWRKQADKEVAQFELSRMKRELLGNLNEMYEADQIEQFNEGVAARRVLKVHVRIQQVHQANELLATKTAAQASDTEDNVTSANLWSIEHGGASEDELDRRVSSRSYASAELDRSLSTVIHSSDMKSVVSNMDSKLTALLNKENLGDHSSDAGCDSTPHTDPRSATVSTLEGTMWDPYAVEEIATQAASQEFQSTLDRIIAEQTHWTEEEEEFSYVPCLTLTQALEAFRDTVLGLEYLHYQVIIHRDIKPANLLWTRDYRVKISDFGVSYLGKPIREDDNNEEIEEADAANHDEAIELAKTVGTPAFYAPELCDPELFDTEKNPERPQITGQIDVWALGVTLYGMIFGRLPFWDVSEFSMYEKIARQEVFVPSKRLRGVEDDARVPMNSNKRLDDILEYENISEELRDLLKRLLHKEPAKRITLKEVKHHPWVLQGVNNHTAWIDDTDPSLQSQGRKIEVSTKEVDEAVAPLTIVDRIKSGIKRLGSVVRGRDSRKRGESNAKSVDGHASEASRSNTSEGEGRRSSLRGDEQIFYALRASRESTEHPLSQSVVASPEIREKPSYFTENPSNIFNPISVSTGTSPKSKRPDPPGRAISTAESMKTIRAYVPTTVIRESTPPPPEDIPLPRPTPILDTGTSSSLNSIFGGAGRRFVKSMRSRERGHGGDSGSASQSSRSSSVDNLPSANEDPHASPSLAFSSTFAAGYVNQPPVLREDFEDTDHAPATSLESSGLLGASSADSLQHARELAYRRQLHQTNGASSESRTRSQANTVREYPPSPDDKYFYARQERLSSQDPIMAISSSDDQLTSGISESFSHPSIPSVVSGTSSMSTAADEQHHHKGDTRRFSVVGFNGDTPEAMAQRTHAAHTLSIADDDEAGYNGDGDEGEDESDDEGIVFGKKPRS